MQLVTVRIDPATVEALDRLADADDRSRSNVIRRALREYTLERSFVPNAPTAATASVGRTSACD